MSLLKKLQIGNNALGLYNKEYLLADYKCHTSCRHNEYRPDASMSCERIELTIVAPGMEDMSIYDWFINHSSVNGRILIELPNTLHKDRVEFKTIEFEGASCFSLDEHYEIKKNQRRVLLIGMIADKVIIDGVVYERF